MLYKVNLIYMIAHDLCSQQKGSLSHAIKEN